MNTEYNGWTNYETWAVKLWMDNEESSYRFWAERAQECADEAKGTLSANARLTGKEPFTTQEKAAFALSRELKDHFEEGNPVTDASVWADLMNAALSEVNWHEIAKSLLDDCDFTEEETEEETEA